MHRVYQRVSRFIKCIKVQKFSRSIKYISSVSIVSKDIRCIWYIKCVLVAKTFVTFLHFVYVDYILFLSFLQTLSMSYELNYYNLICFFMSVRPNKISYLKIIIDDINYKINNYQYKKKIESKRVNGPRSHKIRCLSNYVFIFCLLSFFMFVIVYQSS